MFKIKDFIVSTLIILVTIEVFALVAIKLLHYTNIWYKYPTYLYWGPSIQENYDPLGPHYIDTDSVSWATWHIPNSEIRHKGDCFDVNMRFNSMGARGILPDKNDKNNTIFLGDSFIEGFALAENETIPAQYSQFKKTSVLNLGGGGSFGSTQMAMIYDSIGQSFKHKAVIVCLYLENDFIDDDISLAYPKRYRPYLVKSSDGKSFNIVYKDSLHHSIAKANAYQKGQKIERVQKYSISDYFKLKDKPFIQKLVSLTHTSRFFMEIYYRAKSKKQEPMEVQFTQNNVEILKYNLAKIAKRAEKEGAEMYVLNIPSKYLMYALETNLNYKTKIDSVINHCLVGQKAHYLDLTQHILNKKTPINELYFNCDSHFNTHGSFIMAEYLLYHTNTK
ncbi:MAG: hypothetical protein V4683_00945 [Bacteroidota bacterium]